MNKIGELREALELARILIQSELNTKIHQPVECDAKQLILDVILKALGPTKDELITRGTYIGKT